MASYYPEGECFFRRDSLVYPGGWSAADEEHFYSHVLIEYHWNGWVVKNTQSADYTHPRSQLLVGRGALWRTDFGVWDKFFVGETVDRNDINMPVNMLAITTYRNSDNFNECRDVDSGGPLKYILRPIQIRDKKTQWLWIDGTVPLRAIYFPVCYQSDEAFQDYCTYAVIDLRARQSVQINDVNGVPRWYVSSPEKGLDYVRDTTWGFNVPNIITYLSLPRQVRNPEQGLYTTKHRGDELFTRVTSQRFWYSPEPTVDIESFHPHMDLAEVISATFGVEVGWRPYQYSSFIVGLLQRAVEMALGFVPGVGPLLSVGFGIAMQAIANPGLFRSDNILDLKLDILEAIIESAIRGRKYMAPNILPTSEALADTKALTEDERKARKETGEALNAELTKMVRQMYGQDPPQSKIWLDRIADAARTARTTDDTAQTKEDAAQTKEDAAQTKEDAAQTKEDAAQTKEDAAQTPEDVAHAPEDEAQAPEDAAQTIELGDASKSVRRDA